MSGDDHSGHQKKLSRSLFKSWGKKSKDDDSNNNSPISPDHFSTAANKFNLNQDVVDFLKPSTEKHVPKLDIALAKRWPESQEVRRMPVGAESHPAAPANIYTKPKRRKGLTVSFVRTLPEIIGEGGDEAPDPTLEISRNKAKMSRSASERRPSAAGDPYTQARAPPLPEFQPQQQQQGQHYAPRPPSGRGGPPSSQPPTMQDMGSSPPMRRTNTSGNEFSPPMQRKIVPGNGEAPIPHRPSIGRTPTGVSIPGVGAGAAGPRVEDELQLPPSLPSIDTQVGEKKQVQDADLGLPPQKEYSGLEPALEDPASPVAVKKREMRASEGQALRRMSMMVPDDLAEDEEDDSANGQTGPRTSHLPSVLSPEAASGMHPGFEKAAPGDYVPSPDSASTMDSPGPFADPKYINQHPGERAAASKAFSHRPHPAVGKAIAPPPVPQIGPPTAQPQARSLHSYSNSYAAQPQDRHVAPQTRGGSRASEPPKVGPNFSHFYTSDAIPPTRKTRACLPRDHHITLKTRQKDSHQYTHDLMDLPRAYITSPQRRHPILASLLGPGVRAPASPMSRPVYGEARQSYQNARSTIGALREIERPSSAASYTSSILRAPASPSVGGYESDAAAESAYNDFAGRVAHMKGVFRLTAEREQPADKCSPSMWLRAALWWYLHGKMGLENLLRQQDRRGLLTQAHVDLGKAWWILVDRLEVHTTLGEQGLDEGVSALRYHLKSLSLAMSRNTIFPPEQSLIQGQDTRIWLEYPRFTMDAAAVLGGNTSTSMIVEDQKQGVNPYELLLLGDSRGAFCYGRFPVEVSIKTDEQETDRVVLACMLTVSRDRSDYQTSLSIASQTDLVSIRVLPEVQGKRTLTWSDVAFHSTSSSLNVRLPRGFDLTVRMQERDFRAVGNLTSYAQKVERSLRAAQDERLIHEVRLVELQYADSANAHGFPSEKLKGCMAMVYEKITKHTDGNGIRRLHRGYRILLITEPGHKTLSTVSHDIGRKGPILFEYLTDQSAGGAVAMVLRIREEQRQCRILLVFPDASVRQELYAALTGIKLQSDESIISKTSLSSLLIESADPAHFSATPSPLQSLKWSTVSVTNGLPDPTSPTHARHASSTVESDALRLVAQNATGTLTDRLNLGKGELLLRFPPPSPATPRDTIQLLRARQEDATLAIDVRSTPPHIVGELSKVHNFLTSGATLRTLSFPTVGALHAFHEAVTGYTVLFDGLATTFAISRRRMVVPIYKKLEAGNVRIVVVSRSATAGGRQSFGPGAGGGGGGGCGGVDTKVLAFMEGFAACEALCVRVREMDVVEKVKGGGVKLVDAKFTLVAPGTGTGGEEEGDGGGFGGLKGRFVNLEGLEYAEEHDDLTVGFEGEGDSDAFAQALPATVGNVSRGFTLKRRT
ncbi:uncharacterized protein MYCGRDRAFT_88680 [Zymoseptoria tritici IPO323]|uniref:Uncharacterized protein n=1 Tax=Zymoseptoria tritici (strain CBS 115943 / IPO323) TaxID=336722 RepID=F9WXF8_ZYMTI|nr:uncharacterized protein MYCGRDRAFT_88680 [Zymoseptoria tritici IPO323]EGP92739.1 hypothetical protein MYCGRDRAFT_88680 [Zymoseptoria tritici IPO323]